MRDEYDFTDSQRGAIVKSNKERITIRLDVGKKTPQMWCTAFPLRLLRTKTC